MPLPLTVSCFNKIQIGFTYLVPADLGSPGKRAVKRVCVCVCCLVTSACSGTQLGWASVVAGTVGRFPAQCWPTAAATAAATLSSADVASRTEQRDRWALGHIAAVSCCPLPGSCLEKELMQGTMPGARRRGRPRTAWMDNIKTWTGLSVEESVRMTEDRDKCYEQNRYRFLFPWKLQFALI